MPKNPYEPPNARVADVIQKERARWGRATWLHLPIFALLLGLTALEGTAPPWWTDALYYSTLVVFLVGVILDNTELMVAGATPTVVISGVAGFVALATEKRHGVRVYISGRRYVFVHHRAL